MLKSIKQLYTLLYYIKIKKTFSIFLILYYALQKVLILFLLIIVAAPSAIILLSVISMFKLKKFRNIFIKSINFNVGCKKFQTVFVRNFYSTKFLLEQNKKGESDSDSTKNPKNLLISDKKSNVVKPQAHTIVTNKRLYSPEFIGEYRLLKHGRSGDQYLVNPKYLIPEICRNNTHFWCRDLGYNKVNVLKSNAIPYDKVSPLNLYNQNMMELVKIDDGSRFFIKREHAINYPYPAKSHIWLVDLFDRNIKFIAHIDHVILHKKA